MSTIIGRTAINILDLLATKLSKAGDVMSGDLQIDNGKFRAGTTTDILGSALEILRNGIQVGRIDNNSNGLRVQAQTGSLQLRGSGNTGISIASTGIADFASMPTVAGASFPSGARPGNIDRSHMPAGCWVRPPRWHKDGALAGAMAGNIWLIPFHGSMDPGETQSVDRVRVHIEAAGSSDSTLLIGIYDTDPVTWRPSGTPVRQTTISTGITTGQVEAVFTAWTRPTTRPIYIGIMGKGTTPPGPSKYVLDNGQDGWYGTDGNAAGEPAYTGNAVLPLGFSVSGQTALSDLNGSTNFLLTTNLPFCAMRYV